MGEGMSYTTLKVQDQPAAGMYGLTPDMRAQGVPTHWTVYFTVLDATQSAAKAKELGGKILMGPLDAHDIGRMAVIEDPTGAKFALWQPLRHIGATIVNEIGTPAWPELATRDAAKAEAFYTSLLGWGAKKGNMPMPYTEWQLGGQSIGGMMEMDGQWGDTPPHWMIYVMVADCDAVAAKAAELGGTVCVPPTDIPKVGHFAVLNDPQGAYFSIIKLNGMPQ
jgi:predicted enzyme related to lactoylglutathione lyase